MNTSASHPALTDLCLLIRDHGLGKWFATAPSSVEVTEHPGKIWGHSAKLEFKSASGTTVVFVGIRDNRKLGGSTGFSVAQPRGTATVADSCLVYVPQSHPNFHCGFENVDDAEPMVKGMFNLEYSPGK